MHHLKSMIYKKTLLVLDLDGTITTTDNLVQFSLFMIKKQKQPRFLFFFPLVFLLKLGFIDNKKFKLLYARWILRGIKTQSISQMVDFFLNSDFFKTSFNNKVLDFIDKFSEADKIILSANFMFIVKPIAKILNIPHQISIIPEIQNGRYTHKTKGVIPYGQAKIDAIKPFLYEMNYSKTVGLADSKSDLVLLNYLDEGYLIKYNKKSKSTTITRV